MTGCHDGIRFCTASNIVFVDSPVGVGYSYSNTTSDYDYLDDELTGTNCCLTVFIIYCNSQFLMKSFAE